MPAINLSNKALVVVTGASRGIGQTIAVEISRKLAKNSIMILLARSEANLNKTKTFILENIEKSLKIHTFSLDLGKPDAINFDDILETVVQNSDLSDIDFGIIFHNAGTTGEVKQTIQLSHLQLWQQNFDLNVFSAVLLNNCFISKFRQNAKHLAVINITSLCGRSAFENLAMYGSGKAARDLIFKVLAIEEGDIVVLNYSPGPVDTDMVDGIIKNAQSKEVQNNFKKIKETSILTKEQTVAMLLSILEKGDFQSGDTVDYFDRI